MQSMLRERLILIAFALKAIIGVEAFLHQKSKRMCSLRSNSYFRKAFSNVLLHESSEEGYDADETDYSIPEDIPSEDSIDQLVNQAISDSISKAESELPEDLQDAKTAISLMEDESFQKDVAAIFDKASADMKSAMEEIRKEQEEYAKESSAKSAARVEAQMKEGQNRLEMAQASLAKVRDTVEKEKAEVEKARLELEEAVKNNSDSKDFIMSVATGGIVKQGALAGTILFTLRSITDLVFTFSGDSTHALPALIQGALALAFAAYLFFG